MESKLLLVGAGNMAIDYAHVLNNLEHSFDVVCRTQKKRR
jgi:thioredoxin reductase